MSRPVAPHRRAWTRVECLLVLVAVGLLLGLAVPAVVAAQDKANLTKKFNRLGELGRAVHLCGSVHQMNLPPTVGPFAQKDGTIHYHLLPFLEQNLVYKANATDAVIPVFLDEADPSAPRDNQFAGRWPTANFAANWLVFKHGPNAGGRLPGTFKDGTSWTILFTERYQVCRGTPMVWSHDQLSHRAPAFALHHQGLFQVAPAQADCDPALPQALSKDGIYVVMGDASVHRIRPTVSATVWWRACHPADAKMVGEDFFKP